MKQALCIKADFDEKNKTIGWLFNQPTFVRPREGENNCEEDASVWQIIPYVCIAHGDNNDLEILTYRRGSGSGEQRLKAKMSVGFGGHVDTEVPDTIDLFYHLVDETKRELKEELNLEISYEDIAECFRMNLHKPCIYPNKDDTGVGAHHIGLPLIICLTNKVVDTQEFDQITDLQWMSFLEVLDKKEELEDWSVRFIQNELLAHYEFGSEQ